MSIKSYQDLVVWQKSMDLCVKVYDIAKHLPREETYALSDQIRRSCVSIPSNIAEGQQRFSPKEFAQFLSIAKGSLAELETQILLIRRLDLCSEENAKDILTDCSAIGKMLSSLMAKVKDDSTNL